MKTWLSPKTDALPTLLQAHPRWVVWAIDGSGRKVPRNARKPDRGVDATKPSNWTDFDTAKTVLQKAGYGLGFALGPVQDGPTFSGIDLDKCRDPQTGIIEPWALAWIRRINSYTEISPSGTGVKIFTIGSLPPEAKQGKVFKVEVYDRERYFTLTGHHLPSTPESVENREEELRAIHADLWSRDLIKLFKLFGLYISDGGEFLNVHCPWEANHTSDNKTRDAGLHITDGKANGFKCFHAGCHDKDIAAVRHLFGLKGAHSNDFITDTDGKIVKDNQENIRRAITLLDATLSHDVFAEKIYLHANGQRRPLDDAAANRLWLVIDDTFHFRPSREFFDTVCDDSARANPVHPVRDYLRSLTWDKKPRIDKWLIDLGGAKDTPFVRKVSAIVLIAAVRRARQPGCKFDEMLVLVSDQGKLKSSAIAALCPNPEWFSDDLPLNVDAKQMIERTSGRWLIESSDLTGMRKGDIEHLKAMLSRTVDGPVRLAYKRHPEERPRSFIILGTTNNMVFLKDQTGNRRFWPVSITRAFIVKEIEAIRDQLWAEAAFREGEGESIRLPEEFYGEAAQEQNERRLIDPWEEVLLDSDIDWNATHISSEAIWALLGVSHHDPRNVDRLYGIMQRLGYTKRRCRYEGRNAHFWVREQAPSNVIEGLFGKPDFIK